MGFQKAVKTQSHGRFAITAPSGGGKTMTAIRIARGLGEKIAVVDSENGSASKYVGECPNGTAPIEFDTLDISSNTHPNKYIEAIHEAEKAGYDVLVIDSLTHAWEATKQEVEKVKSASRSGNGYTAWSEGTKLWKALESAIMASPLHIIVTMRSKTEYAQEKDSNGKSVIRKLGLAPEVRDGSEYAFDVVIDLTVDHVATISKTRCSALDKYVQERPGEELGQTLKAWLTSGVVKLATTDMIDKLVDFARVNMYPEEEITAFREQKEISEESARSFQAKLVAFRDAKKGQACQA